jgi:hypothetical protein
MRNRSTRLPTPRTRCPTNDYSLDITIDDYQGYFVPGGRKTTGLSFGPGSSGAASGLYFNSGTDTAVTTQGLSRGDSYTVQVSDPVKLEHGQLTQYDFARISLPDTSRRAAGGGRPGQRPGR